MKKFFALAILVSVAACSEPAKDPQPQPVVTSDVDGSVDECPRADGTPCR
jgi:hypothetical protein